MKNFFRDIHLYLSLAAGLVILIACITGAILVFEKDMQMAFNKERYFVDPGTNPLSAGEMSAKVQEAYPDAKVNGIKLYKNTSRSAEVSISISEKKQKAAAGLENKISAATSKRAPGYTVFVNPYSGAVLDKYTYSETFFYQVFALHRWLLGGSDSIGKYIVGIATLIFLFIILTGIILWWPRTKKILKQRLKIKTNVGWKRVNHDLHLVLGFYSAIFLFVFAFTGLAWSFKWFNDGIYKVTSSPLKSPPPPESKMVTNAQAISFADALSAARSVYPDAVSYAVSKPKDTAAAFSVVCLPENAVHESATDVVYVDQYSGMVAGQTRFGDRSLGARVRSTFKPVHTGSIWGMPSKVLAFIVCLFGASFPITGTLMWINRTRKKNRNRNSAVRNKMKKQIVASE